MTKPKKCQKSESEKNYKPKKRKNISPIHICEQKSGAKVNTSQLSGQLLSEQWKGSVSPESNEQCQNKRFHQSSPEYFNFGPYAEYINNLNTMPMNFPSIPFGSGFIQSPPFNSAQFLLQVQHLVHFLLLNGRLKSWRT